MFKNTASQKITVFAFDSATGLPKTGDAANITVYVSKDDGAVTVLGDTTATEADATNAKGDYLFDLTQTETNADKLRFTGKSATSGIVIVPQTIYTLPATGILAPTVSGRTLDVSAGGEAGIDWANIGSPTTSQNLSSTTIATTQKVDLETIKTQTVATTGAGTITVPAAATLASTTNITAGTIATVSGNVNGSVGSVTGAVGSVTGAVGSVTGNVGGNVTGSVGSVASGGIAAASFAAGAIDAAAIANNAIDRATFAADTGLQTTRSNTAQAGGATSITLDASASATTDYYINQLVYITGGTGVGQAKFCTAYNGTTKVATVNSAWATNPDNTSTFAIIPFDSIPGATAPTAAQNATALLTDLLSGTDFNTAGSFGKLIKDNLDAAITSRMATYTQPTGFLAATFPTTVASTTNITSASGVVLASGGLANVTAWTVAITGNITGNLSGSVGSVTGAVGSVTGAVGSIGSGGITTASFATGAINAAALAADVVNDIWMGTALTEAYATDGSAATPAQLLYQIWSAIAEISISGTTMTCKKLDGSTTAMTFTLNDATNPTSRTRAT